MPYDLTQPLNVTFDQVIADLEAYLATAPIPAPLFTTQPSITPNGGVVGTTFTASNGEATNTLEYTRRWLLSGSPIGTNSTVTPSTAGSLVLEVTATGPGGVTVTTSQAVAVTAVTPPPTGTIISGGDNIVTITSLDTPAALTATGGINSISVTGA
jgi:hypothetical protein